MRKRSLSLLLTLLMCLSLSVPTLAADYGKLTISGTNLTYSATEVTIEFEAAKLEKEQTTFVYGEEDVVQDVVNIVTLKPGSKVTIKDSENGDTTSLWPYSIMDGKYWEYPRGVQVSSGSVSDWGIGKTLMNGGDTVGLLSLPLKNEKGEEIDYYFKLGDETAEAPVTSPAPAEEKLEVQPTNQKLSVNGMEQATEIYNINGSNFFKLRDMAALLNGTGSQFSVDYDKAEKMISVKTGEAYQSVGGELTTGTDKSASTVKSSQSIQVNGQKLDLTAYNIGGNNFFKLRELGEALNFSVDYDNATRTMLVTSKSD